MRTDTTVRDVMHREFLGVSESDALADAAGLMVAEGTDCLVVLRGGEAVGRLSARDALSAVLDGDAEGSTVGAVMRPPPPTVAPGDRLRAVTERLVGEDAGRVVVVDDGEAVGVVTAGDSLAAGVVRGGGPSDARPDAPVDGGEGGGATRGSERARDADSADAVGSSTQGVCEVCGSLVPELGDANGQAVCHDCREV